VTKPGVEEARLRRRTARNRFVFVTLVVAACATVTVGVFVGQGSDQQGAGLTTALGLEGPAPTGHLRMIIAHDLGLSAGGVVHRTSVTDPQVIASATTQLDHLGPFPNGPIKCPNDDGDTFVVTFTSENRSSPTATARVGVAGCRTVRISLRGHKRATFLGTQHFALFLTRLDP
jgi:hypothetical protein